MANVGITSIGAYVPYYFIPRAAVAGAWAAKGQKGTRSLINFDEDSVTLAWEAAEDCFRFVSRPETDALFFASTTAPYAEKSHAALVANALDLSPRVFTADFAQCTKAGTSALRLALDSCAAGSCRQAVVTAADCRNAYPKTANEQMNGDAAGAVAVGTEHVAAVLNAAVSANNEITDVWRNAGDTYVSYAEGRFATNYGYLAEMKSGVQAAAAKAGLSLEQIDRFVFTTSTARDHLTLAKKLGIPAEKVQDPMMGEVGYSGTAQPLFLLAAALEQAKPGERLLLAAYGNGVDAFVFTVTEEVVQLQRGGIQRYLDTRGEVASYARFLSYRGLLHADPGQPYQIKSSTAAEWRMQDTYIRCYGSRCKACGQAIFPAHRVCGSCGAVDNYETYRAPDRTVRVYTYTLDEYAGRSDFPLVGQVVAEDSEGARYYMNTTDFQRSDVVIGAELEFTFRKVHHLAGFVNYYWKLRPLRRQKEVGEHG